MESIFSIDIGKFTVEKFHRVVATPVKNPKMVCFYPIGDLDGRKCERLKLVTQPLQVARVRAFINHTVTLIT